jgi:RNA polymerase subunit RPABC4/transcription elongation factor Spt4
MDKAYAQLDKVADRITRLHELLLKQLVEEVTKNGLRLRHEQCHELRLPIWSVMDIKCCDNQILVPCEFEYWSPFEPSDANTLLCVACGKRFAKNRQVCPNCGKDIELAERWQEISETHGTAQRLEEKGKATITRRCI